MKGKNGKTDLPMCVDLVLIQFVVILAFYISRG